jgi:FO synthase
LVIQAKVKAEALLKQARQGKPLGKSEALFLSALEHDGLAPLLEAASDVRDAHKGRTITFSPKIFIPLTNLCRDFCGYCTFRKAPGEAGAKTMTIEEVLGVVRRGKELGCAEVLLSLGDRPEAIYPEMRTFLQRKGLRRTLDYLYEAAAFESGSHGAKRSRAPQRG